MRRHAPIAPMHGTRLEGESDNGLHLMQLQTPLLPHIAKLLKVRSSPVADSVH